METLSHETLRLIHEHLPSPVDRRHMGQVVQMDSICLEFVQTLIVNQCIFMQQLSHRMPPWTGYRQQTPPWTRTHPRPPPAMTSRLQLSYSPRLPVSLLAQLLRLSNSSNDRYLAQSSQAIGTLVRIIY
uniref:Uncharacterized protein n=1 Tax=Oryza meridionalis TaxID=40149 RepID=A0A0E0D6R1_9ORYZ